MTPAIPPQAAVPNGASIQDRLVDVEGALSKTVDLEPPNIGAEYVSHLIEFYRGESADSEGRFLRELWEWNDEELEFHHDYIQWMFPLPEPSQFNPDAPLLTADDIATFRHDALLRSNLRKSLDRILAFLGLESETNAAVVEGANFSQRIPTVWAYFNHNWLRVTRILRSLKLLGLEEESRALFQKLDAFYRDQRFPITAETFAYWEDAVS